MPTPLETVLAQRRTPSDPQNAWRQASRIGTDLGDINDPDSWKMQGIPLGPWKSGGMVAKLLSRIPGLKSVPSVIESLAATQSARDLLNPTAAKIMGQMYQEAHPVFKSMENAGAFAGPRTVGGMRIATPVAETLGEQNPYFTARGGEGMYNIGQGPVKTVNDSANLAYLRLMNMMGK